ncbi:hypothetical protein [Gordonibacter sp. 28C]|uniref:hypothetical protein n=1 Tax=Gordonibacter sp. 28C TaxID=2078569 RepID=UPI0011C02A85|nr:hypothetical protein [Gordonibacter sp. 28C]
MKHQRANAQREGAMKSPRAWSAPVIMLAVALAFALAACLVPTTKAAAYYNFGTVGVYPGGSYLSVQAGQSTSTSISVDPSSSDQTLGCGMAKCPQVCTSEEVIEANYTCFDVNGQCTCAGTSYSTYYPEVYASSSNGGVATAYVSGGTLVVTGNSAGSATITVTASLRQWTTNSASIQVDVTEPPTSGGSTSGGGGGGSSSSEIPASSLSATSTPSTAGVPREATPTESKDDALNETVIETVAGKVIVVEKNSFLETRTQFEKIIGTKDQVVFWSGSSSDRPDYSWTFVGEDVSADSPYLDFDPTITVSKLGAGNVSNIMKQAKDGLVMEFAHEGDLPGEASVYVKVGDAFSDGTELGLFCFDDKAKRFERAQEGLKVQDGYVSFKTTHCSTWAFSTDDLASYEVEETNTPGAISVNKQDSIADEGSNGWIVPVAVGIVVVAAAAVVAVVLVRRRKRADSGTDVEQEGAPEAEKPPVAKDEPDDAR